MNKKLFSALLSTLLFFSTAESLALTISHPESSSYGDFNKPTHILVVGYAGGLGAQLFRVAAHRAQRYMELNPGHAAVIIGPDRVDIKIPSLASYEGYKSMLRTLRLKTVLMDERWLLNHRLMDIVLKYNNIESVDFVSHSAAHQGVGLDEVPDSNPAYKYKRFNLQTEGLEKLAARLSPGAFVMLHGCNSAFSQAPELSKILKVPVAGSLTYTNFQELFSDKKWYFNDSGKYPAGLSRATSNGTSFTQPQPCSKGGCHRMQPEPYPYAGFWGKLTAGLAHYKFFCGTSTPSLECKKSMAKSLMANMNPIAISPKSSLEDFKLAAKDYLCPDVSRLDKRAECFQALERSLVEENVVPFTGMTRGHTVQCDFKTCDVQVKCTDTPGSCKVTYVGKNVKPTTTGLEFRAYVEGFLSLKQ